MSNLAERAVDGESNSYTLADLRAGRVPATLPVKAAAALIGVAGSTVYEAVARGTMPALRVGKRILIPTERLLSLLDIEPADAP